MRNERLTQVGSGTPMGESDKGIIMARKLLKEQMQLVADGQGPINMFRDASEAAFAEVPTEEAPFMALPTRRVDQPLSPVVTV